MKSAAEAKATTPGEPRSRDQLTDEELMQIYTAARRIADIVHEYTSPEIGSDKPWRADHRDRSVNPHYRQAIGLFLDFSYDWPHSIWTPWGEWGFAGNGSGMLNDRDVPKVMERLRTVLHRPELRVEDGTLGPTYAVLAVENVELFKPVICDPSQLLPYEEALAAWERLTKQYAAAQ
jgi:hypothetical protein